MYAVGICIACLSLPMTAQGFLLFLISCSYSSIKHGNSSWHHSSSSWICLETSPDAVSSIAFPYFCMLIKFDVWIRIDLFKSCMCIGLEEDPQPQHWTCADIVRCGSLWQELLFKTAVTLQCSWEPWCTSTF